LRGRISALALYLRLPHLAERGMLAALLPDRGVIKVAGDDARKFLNGLVTSDMAKVAPDRAALAALLTPQGKIISDFIISVA
jgi:folate-binding Fe-S cluster repair protein YgfZ